MDEKKIRKAVALAYETNSAAPRITGQGEGFVADAILAKAKELGGIMHTLDLTSTKLLGSKFLGSTIAELMLVKILNSSEQRTS